MTQRSKKGPSIRTVRHSIRAAVPREQAWLAWREPAKLAQWFVDQAEIKGKIYLWRWSDFGFAVPYSLVESTAPRRLLLRATMPGGGETDLDIRITGEGDQCKIEVSQSGVPVPAGKGEEADEVDSGWRMALTILKHYLENHFGHERSRFFLMRPAAFHYDELYPYFRRRDELSRWLVRSGDFNPEEGTVRLTLTGGETLSGRVLVDTGRELVLSWDEIQGVLELKAFPWGGRRMLALRGCGWGLSPERAAEIEEKLAVALDRLVELLSP